MARKDEKFEPVEEKLKADVEYVDLVNEAALALTLASERIQAAQTLVQLRQTEMQAVLANVSQEYTEEGKYRVVEINTEKRKVGRVAVN